MRVLHEDFAAEVGAWAPAAQELRRQLDGLSFPSLWRASVLFSSRVSATLIEKASDIDEAGVVIPLEPHLSVLATKLSLPLPDQLPLFLPMVVSR
jgi:hypothetical protein